MTTEPHDIAVDFATGVNLTEFQREYVDLLVSVAGLPRGTAQQIAGKSNVVDGKRAPRTGRLLIAGTFHIGIDADPIDPNVRVAVDTAIQSQTGSSFAGPILSELDAGEQPGEQAYVFDGNRQNPARGTGSWVYWDGNDSWRYMRDDSVAVTISIIS